MIYLMRQLKRRIAATHRPHAWRPSTRTTHFNAFTPGAHDALIAAQEEAQRLGHNFLGTEHILLGLLSPEGGVSTSLLHDLGVDRARARRAVERTIGRANRSPRGSLCLTVRAKRVIKLATEEAQRQGRRTISTEHLLLGILREGEGVGAHVLQDLGVSLPQARKATHEALDRNPGDL